MTEAEWLVCTDPGPMLDRVRATASDRKLRLFAVAAWRCLRSRHAHQRLVRAVNTAESYADGLIGRQDLLNVKSLAWGLARWYQRVVYDYFPLLRGRQPRDMLLAAYATEERTATLAQRLSEAAGWEELQGAAPALLRDIFGNPFRTVGVEPSWLAWNDGTVVKVAQGLYDERAFDRLPLLADTLEQAGCTNPDILDHCRQPGEHVRGCWLIDHLSGKN